ncbi:MAG: Gfo/Idh/MocA family oxidoreductase [Planctomycetota bacterium]
MLFVGAGAITKMHLRVLGTWQDGETVEVLATDLKSEALDELRAARPAARTFDNIDDMLAEPVTDGDIVVVATPPVAHFEAAMKALASGRHVLCEKPLAMTTDEARQMNDAAKSAGRLLGCCSNRLMGRGLAAFRDRFDNGLIDKPYRVRWQARRQRRRSGIEYQPESRWFLKSAISGGGVLMDWGLYDITTMCNLFRPQRVEVVSSIVEQPKLGGEAMPDFEPDVEFHVIATLRFHRDDGSMFDVHYERASATHGEEAMHFEVEGVDGAARIDWLPRPEGARGYVHVWDDDGKRQSQEHYLVDEPADIMQRPLLEMRKAVAGEPAMIPLGDEAVFNFSVIRAIYDAAESGESVVVEREVTS